MRKRLIYIITISAILIFNFACGKNENNKKNNNTNINDGIVNASIPESSPTTFKANFGKGVYTKGIGGDPNFYAVNIQGDEESSKRHIYFTIYNNGPIDAGTYNLKFNEDEAAYFYENFNTSSVKAWISPDRSNTDVNLIHGTLTISSLTDTRVKGSFNFKAIENANGASFKNVNSGTFDVPLTKQGF